MKVLHVLVSLLTITTPLMGPLMGCTDFIVRTQDGAIINGRSMEFAIPLNSELALYRSGESFCSHAPNGETSLSWIGKYGFVAANALGLDYPIDGLNEKGLSFGYLWFSSAVYPTVTEAKSKRALLIDDFGTWMLSRFASVAEVRASLADVLIWARTIEQLGRVPPLHVALHDASGNSLVIEFIDGSMVVHDNPLGLLTNAPSFDWHLKNLGNYLHLNANDAVPYQIDGLRISAPGRGDGMVGLPGDWTSPSRFIRIALQQRFVTVPENAAEGINLAEHLLNSVDIAKGLIAIKRADKVEASCTQWTVIKDLTNCVIYFRSYADLGIRKIDLKKLDFTSKANSAKRRSIAIERSQDVEDVTELMQR